MQNDTSSYNAFPTPVKHAWRHGVVAIGNFDGVHKGHQALLQRGRQLADQAGCAFTVLTFSPHPRRFFQPQADAFLLAQPAVKQGLLLDAGADGVVTLPFTDIFSRQSANDFIKHVLEDGLAAKHIVVGQNFVFGYGRQGHVETLMAHGFDVTALSPIADANGVIFSSTAIRQAILSSDMSQAEALLGRPWSITGPIITGHQRGRTIGFPTANITWPAEIIEAPYGVYAVTAFLNNGRSVNGVANIGLRPTINQNTTKPLLEVHLFDFNDDLYGQDVTVKFRHFIRPEQKFPDFEMLKKQIEQDCLVAQQFFA